MDTASLQPPSRALGGRRLRERLLRPRALVIGAGDIGSAIAVTLHRAGYGVILCERPQPSHARRGMAFIDAWYAGEAVLDGVRARHCTSREAAFAALAEGGQIVASSAEFDTWLAYADLDLLVDARMRKRASGASWRRQVPLSIGTGPGFVAGRDVDVVIETEWGSALGDPIWEGPAAPFRGEPVSIAGHARERYVYVPVSGTFRTGQRIGAAVVAGEAVGRVGDWLCQVPLTGVLRGLAPDGAQVQAGEKIVEIDPRGDPRTCFGIGERPARIAAGVGSVLARVAAR